MNQDNQNMPIQLHNIYFLPISIANKCILDNSHLNLRLKKRIT